MIIVDTNILLDLATNDVQWFDWSLNAIQNAATQGPICINQVIYAELSVRYDTLESVDEFTELAGVELIELPRQAAFLAGKAFALYRSSGGTKTGVLSDFFIGAHAATLDVPILTRDTRRFQTYFPSLRLITPNIN